MARHRGFICEVGLWNPQIQLQITPLCWGLALAWSKTKLSGKLGPIAVAIWFNFRGWKARCETFNDRNV